jgi:hypothetical protein
MKKYINYLYILLFCGFLGVMSAFLFLKIQTMEDEAFSKREKRNISTLPLLGWEGSKIKAYFSGLESFVCDRMPLRKVFLGIKSQLNFRFSRGMNPNNIVVGNGGWLFLGNSNENAINQYRGLDTMRTTEQLALEGYFNHLNTYFDSLHITLVVAIAPDKHSIYPEFLPKYLARKGRTRYDQLVERPQHFTLLDLRQSLKAVKSGSALPMYYKTDSHWNTFGAYQAYTSILDTIKKSIDITPLVVPEIDFRVVDTVGEEDLSNQLTGISLEKQYVVLNQGYFKDSLLIKTPKMNNGAWAPCDPNQLYNVFILNNFRIINKGKKGKILVFGDSFSYDLSKYLNNTFGEIYYCRYLESEIPTISDLLSTYKPDVVLFLMVERMLKIPSDKFIQVSDGFAVNSCVEVSNGNLLSKKNLWSGINNVRSENGEIHFTATNDDPIIVLPTLPLHPGYVVINMDITTPAPTMAQLFYQTVSKSEFSEQLSLKKNLDAGRHTISWRIKETQFNGVFRLDPGSMPGDYTIHRVEVCQ